MGAMAPSHPGTRTPLPRSSRSRRVPARMTLREFEAFEAARADEKWELIEGVPCMTPSATGPHNNLARFLAGKLETALGTAEWFVVCDTSVRLPGADSEVRPDVALYRQSDLGDPDALPIRALPRLIIECLSPGTAARDMVEKPALYHKAGVPEYWVVDPKTGAIALFVHKKAGYEQLTVDPKGFIRSPLLKRNLRIVVKPWTFEVLES